MVGMECRLTLDYWRLIRSSTLDLQRNYIANRL